MPTDGPLWALATCTLVFTDRRHGATDWEFAACVKVEEVVAEEVTDYK